MSHEPVDYTLDYMKAEGITPTANAYIRLNWMGEYECLDDLEGEDWAGVMELVEDGELIFEN